MVELSELVLRVDPVATFAELAARDCIVRYPKTGWQLLSGGRESMQSTAIAIQVDGIASQLIIGLSRMRHEPHQMWVDGFDLRPGGQETAAWVDRIREMLAQAFDLALRDPDGVEIYKRGAIEQSMLFPGSSTESPRVLMHRRHLIHNPDEN